MSVVLEPDEINEVKTIFALVDNEKTGRINVSEAVECLDELGFDSIDDLEGVVTTAIPGAAKEGTLTLTDLLEVARVAKVQEEKEGQSAPKTRGMDRSSSLYALKQSLRNMEMEASLSPTSILTLPTTPTSPESHPLRHPSVSFRDQGPSLRRVGTSPASPMLSEFPHRRMPSVAMLQVGNLTVQEEEEENRKPADIAAVEDESSANPEVSVLGRDNRAWEAAEKATEALERLAAEAKARADAESKRTDAELRARAEAAKLKMAVAERDIAEAEGRRLEMEKEELRQELINSKLMVAQLSTAIDGIKLRHREEVASRALIKEVSASDIIAGALAPSALGRWASRRLGWDQQS